MLLPPREPAAPRLGAVWEPEGGPCECERARAADPRSAPGLCTSFSGGRGGACLRPRASLCPVQAGWRLSVLASLSPGPSLESSALLSPTCLPPRRSLPKSQPPVHRRNPTPPARRPGGEAGTGPSRRGGRRRRRLLPPPRLLPLPRLTLPPREGCLEGSGRPKPEPRSASYDQLGVCLLLPRAQVGEQASVQNMSEGGDGQGRGVGEDHHQRGRHAT